MENKVLNANLDALKKYDKHLADEILSINKTKSTFELIQNKNGEYNLIKNSIPLHSLVGAQTEAQKITEKIPDISEKNTIRIIWGLGLGYLADEFISRSNGAIIIYEPDIELLRVVFEMVEFEKNLQKSNVFLTNDPKKLLKMLDMLSDKETKITISFLSSYLSLYKNEIYKTAEFVEKTRGEKQANINTINKLGPLATINTLSNIRKIISTPLVSSLKDIYKDKTALVASAGPSLAENIETIKKNREKFVLFGLEFTTIPIMHGKLPIIGYKFQNFVYITDAKTISDESYDIIKSTKVCVYIINTLNEDEHPTHFTFEQTLKSISIVSARDHVKRCQDSIHFENIQSPFNYEVI